MVSNCSKLYLKSTSEERETPPSSFLTEKSYLGYIEPQLPHLAHRLCRLMDKFTGTFCSLLYYNSSGSGGLPDCTGWTTIRSTREWTISAAANAVISPWLSNGGATSTTSAPTTLSPSRPARMERSSLVDHPPLSGVPVATYSQIWWAMDSRQRVRGLSPGAKAGSSTSISTLI